MTKRKLTTADYPISEQRPDLIRGKRGKVLGDLTLDGLISGEVTLEDLRITPEALRLQAEVAEAAGRPTLGQNFERAAELTDVPQDVVMRIYELLRPGRAKSKDDLLAAATELRGTYKADRMATFIEEAAEVYDKRGLFVRRF